MARKEPVKTSIIDIIDYWARRVYEGDLGIDWADAIIDRKEEVKGCGGEMVPMCVNGLLEKQGLVNDEGEADWNRLKELKGNFKYRCWRCADIGKVERCHINAAQFGGKGEPSNLVLLCKFCHEQAPDIRDDKEAIWDWIKATKKPFYEQFWTEELARSFKEMYGRNPCSGDSEFYLKFKSANEKEKKRMIDKFLEEYKKSYNDMGIHAFADTHLGIAPSTKSIILKRLGA